jgi:hypothetical protein
MTTPGDGLEIPAFLIVTPDEQARRVAWNAAHPITATQFMPLKPSGNTEDDEVWKAREEQRKAAAKAASMKRLQDWHAKQKMESATPRDGQVWKNGRYVRSDAISAARAARIMSELPTASMRKIFTDQYGPRVEGGIVWPPAKPKESKGKKRGDIH